MFSCEFREVFKNTYFVEYMRKAVSESAGYNVHILQSEVRLEEEGEYKHYLRIHLFFYKKSIFERRPENCLSFSKKPPLKIV